MEGNSVGEGERRMTEGTSHHRWPPHSNSGLVSFFSKDFHFFSRHVYTLKSSTSCPRSGIFFCANASSGRRARESVRSSKLMAQAAQALLTVIYGDYLIHLHSCCWRQSLIIDDFYWDGVRLSSTSALISVLTTVHRKHKDNEYHSRNMPY